MSDEILPGPLCCDAWFTYVYVGVCSGPPLANRVSTSSIEPVHPATDSIPHHVTSSCAPFGRLCGDAWICVVSLHTTCEGSHEELPVLNLQDVLCRHMSSRDVSHHVAFMCSNHLSRVRHMPHIAPHLPLWLCQASADKKNCLPSVPAPLGGQAVALPSLGWLLHWQSMPQSRPAAITDPLVLTPRRHGRAPHL